MSTHIPDKEDEMPQYAILLYERVAPDELPQEVVDGHMAMTQRVADSGGRIIAGLALQDPSTATSIRGDLVTDGPFIETKEVLAGVFAVEARDLDHALAIGRMVPIVEGGVEVWPLLGFQIVEEGA